MDAPHQYVTTADGVRIAYSTPERPGSDFCGLAEHQYRLRVACSRVRAVREASASLFKLVRYDPRGFGMSQRNVEDSSLDALVRDLEAVAGRTGGDDFNLMAVAIAVPVALAFAARKPPGLKRLVLMEGSAHGSAMFDPRLLAMLEAAGDDWELASESFMRAIHGWDEDAAGRRGRLSCGSQRPCKRSRAS
jgi:pimeloyl-ACP methyl ester carboxylesterase